MSIHTTMPFELFLIDCLHFENSSGAYEYILVVIDHFIRFMQAYATPSKSGTTATINIYNNLILCFGFPSHVHHDKGTEPYVQTDEKAVLHCTFSIYTIPPRREWPAGTFQ